MLHSECSIVFDSANTHLKSSEFEDLSYEVESNHETTGPMSWANK